MKTLEVILIILVLITISCCLALLTAEFSENQKENENGRSGIVTSSIRKIPQKQLSATAGQFRSKSKGKSVTKVKPVVSKSSFAKRTSVSVIGSEDSGRRPVKVLSTAYYHPLPNQAFYLTGSYRKELEMNGRGVTYKGDIARVGHVAVDPRYIPFNTIMHIPGYGNGVARDIGRDIKGYRIDVFVGRGEEGLRQAMAWGKRYIDVKILK